MAETGMTVKSSHDAFAAATDLTQRVDWRHLADLLEDDDSRVASKAAVEAHALVERALRVASGQLETAVYRGGRYSRADIKAMSTAFADDDGPLGLGVCNDMIVQLVCTLALWVLVQRRRTDVNPRSVAGVPEAMLMLEALRLGEAIFPFQPVFDAGVQDYIPLDPSVTRSTYQSTPISSVASRMFGTRARSFR